MADKREIPEEPVATDDGHGAHPVEPAEGAVEPGEDPAAAHTAHPDEPAEGGR